MDELAELHPVLLALIATCGTWLVTALGAALVFFSKRFSQKYLDASLGMAAGVMIAASFWSLLAPAIDMAEKTYGQTWKWLPPLVGFILGAVVLRIADRLIPHLHPDLAVAEGPKTSWHRSTLLVLAITLHNIPEGLAVGVAFGAAARLSGDARGQVEFPDLFLDLRERDVHVTSRTTRPYEGKHEFSMLSVLRTCLRVAGE